MSADETKVYASVDALMYRKSNDLPSIDSGMPVTSTIAMADNTVPTDTTVGTARRIFDACTDAEAPSSNCRSSSTYWRRSLTRVRRGIPWRLRFNAAQSVTTVASRMIGIEGDTPL